MYGSDSYYYLFDLDKCMELLDLAAEYSTKSGNKPKIAAVHMRQGALLTQMGKFAESSLSIQAARSIFVELKDTANILGANNSLSVLYSELKFFKEASALREESIELSKKLHGNPRLDLLYFNAAVDSREKGDDVQRIAYLKLLEPLVSNGNQLLVSELMVDCELAIAYAETDSLKLAEHYFDKLVSNKEELERGANNDLFVEASKQLAFARKDYEEAIKFGKEHLELKKERGVIVEIYNAEKFLANVYKAAGDLDMENHHLVAYYKIFDSISNVRNVQTLAYYQTIYETEKRDLKIEAQESNISFLKEKDKVKNQLVVLGGLGTFGLFGLFWLIRSRNFERKKQKLQVAFTRDILKTQERERARIASELHDSIGQKLLVIKNALVTKNADDKNEIEMVSETIKEVREMSHNLHPFQFEKLGLMRSLKNMIESFQKSSNVFYSEEIEVHNELLDKEKGINIFRMIQEAMVNVEKHAGATACNLSVTETKDDLLFKLKDNGKGFKKEFASQGLGMKTLHERAQLIGGHLEVLSELGKGTTIILSVPKA
ncbi:MAG: hypothetical protein GC193_10930 [Cryomorphaceae bacterium]|nr:hypothetical protein [Cryomorphaceae bacterium]